MPHLNRNDSEKTIAVLASLCSTTHRGVSYHAREAPLEGPSQWCMVLCCSCRASSALSLLVEEGRYAFGVMGRIWTKF